MNHVTPDQVAYKKKVGKLNGDPVFEVGLIGGLHMIMLHKAGKLEPLGAGPHRAVAQHIAKKRNPEIVFTELSKSDHVDLEHFEMLVPRYEELTDRLVAASAVPEEG